MGIKQFVVYSIIYIGVVATLAFTQSASSYTFSFFGMSVSLPVAVWICMPLILFFMFSILHMCYYSYKFYRQKMAVVKDMKTYDTMAKELMLGLETNKEFKTEFFKDSTQIAKLLSPWGEIDENLSFENKDLQSVVDILNLVKSGEVADLKRFKLPKTNPLFLKNEENKLNKDPKYAVEILKNSDSYTAELRDLAYTTLLQNANFLEIKRFEIPKKKDEIEIIIDRYVNNAIEISKEDIFTLLNSKEFSEDDFIHFAKKLRNSFAPEQLKAMFEKLSNEKADAGEAYLYVLYEIGMIDELREQIGRSDGDEHEKFKILLFLKDNGKSIPASLLF